MFIGRNKSQYHLYCGPTFINNSTFFSTLLIKSKFMNRLPISSVSVSALSENDSSDDDSDRYVQPSKFYGTSEGKGGLVKKRTMSMAPGMSTNFAKTDIPPCDRVMRHRRSSHDEKSAKPRKFLIDVEETQNRILEQEDTDGDFQITINDAGPKVLTLGSANSNGLKKYELRGTYMLSNLLQELALARDYGRQHIVIDESRLNENPVDRLSRMIKYNFWDGLTRRIDGDGLDMISKDPKNRSRDQSPRIYIPYNEKEIFEYYKDVSETKPHLKLQVEYLPKEITPEWVTSVNDKPGLLALAMKKEKDGGKLVGLPFIVPGGRFNEMYGWDSYFEALGLIEDNRVELAKAMVEHFVYEIDHYGKILNANRSYYLCRSQPPFLTDMAIQVYKNLKSTSSENNKAWLSNALKAAIKEYHTVWMSSPRLDIETGLSRFYPDGIGVPPETEASHFTHILEPYAAARKLSIDEFTQKYNSGEIHEPVLDEYFIHDRAVRESGHDTTYRFENRCAHLATIDLNSLLYKYEMDIGEIIRDVFDDEFSSIFGPELSSIWFERAEKRSISINKYLWNEEKSLYYDYDTVKKSQSVYESITAIYALWAGVASPKQAEKFVKHSLNKFEVIGGLVSGTEESRGVIALDRPNRQWDYPSGWAPHQILAWKGLYDYGYIDEARRCAYRWLYTITKSFVDFNGVVPEKFDVVNLTHHVTAEYGNQGVDFKLLNREGFGWMNASYQLGLTYLTSHMRRALGTCTHPDVFFSRAHTKPTRRGSRRHSTSR